MSVQETHRDIALLLALLILIVIIWAAPLPPRK